MSKRKEGWYWVKWDNGASGDCWFPSHYDPDSELGPCWSMGGHRYYEESQEDIVEIGNRIPTPDEDWQCVPIQATSNMLCYGGSNTSSEQRRCWESMLRVAPKP